MTSQNPTHPNRQPSELNDLITIETGVVKHGYEQIAGYMDPSVSDEELLGWIKSRFHGLPFGGRDLRVRFLPNTNTKEWQYKVHTD